METLINTIQQTFNELKEKWHSDIYWILRNYKVRYVTKETVELVALLIALQNNGFKTITRPLIDYFLTGNPKRRLESLHRLGDYKILVFKRRSYSRISPNEYIMFQFPFLGFKF